MLTVPPAHEESSGEPSSSSKDNCLADIMKRSYASFKVTYLVLVLHCSRKDQSFLVIRCQTFSAAIGSKEQAFPSFCKMKKNLPPAWINRMCAGWELLCDVPLTRAGVPSQLPFIRWASANHHCSCKVIAGSCSLLGDGGVLAGSRWC